MTDPSSGDEEQGAHEWVLQRTTRAGVVRSIEQANEVINRYEQEAAALDRPGTEGRKPVRTGETPRCGHRSGRTTDRQDPTVEDPSTTGRMPQSKVAGGNGDNDSRTSRARRVLSRVGRASSMSSTYTRQGYANGCRPA